MEAWGVAGKVDPFKDIYNIVVQMSIRLSTCEELASNPRTVKHLGDLYLQQATSTTPMTLLFPWFPCAAKKQKERSAKGLYDILSHHVYLRREAKVPNSDSFDVLIADGESDTAIVQVSVTICLV
jgi:sterol 14-demethylase